MLSKYIYNSFEVNFSMVKLPTYVGDLQSSNHHGFSQTMQRVCHLAHGWQSQTNEGIRIIVNEEQVTDIQADIMGPEKTPYEGGIFRCRLLIDNTFPQNPPKCFFTTKIFHPNISYKGEICVNTLKKDWNPMIWSLQHIFQVKLRECRLLSVF